MVGVQRLYDMVAKACEHTFPDVFQQQVTLNDVVHRTGQGCWGPVRQTVRRLGPHKNILGMANYMVREDGKGCHIPHIPPSKACKTVAPSAHSGQVCMEECLLRLPMENGEVTDWSLVSKSWACGLVKAVAAEAVGLQQPTVIADMVAGQAYLVVFNGGHCLRGWPLDIYQEVEGHLLLQRLLRPDTLATLIVTDPCPYGYNAPPQNLLLLIGLKIAVSTGYE